MQDNDDVDDEIEYMYTLNKEEVPSRVNCCFWKQGQPLKIQKEFLGDDLKKASFKVIAI
jgi:hypothetical protein